MWGLAGAVLYGGLMLSAQSLWVLWWQLVSAVCSVMAVWCWCCVWRVMDVVFFTLT